MFKISKSYRLLNYLNSSHSLPIRAIVASGAWVLSMISCGSAALAGHVARTAMNNDFKTAFRQLHWLTSQGWLRLSVISDPFFDFTEGMQAYQLQTLMRFLDKRHHNKNGFARTTDSLYVLARLAHLKLAKNDQASFREIMTKYKHHADEALSQLAHIEPNKANHSPASSEHSFSKTDARSALHDFAALAEEADIPWYVISGTFLGIVREGGWLDHDYDIDLGIHLEQLDLDKTLSKINQSDCFVVRKLDYQLRIARDKAGSYLLERLPALVKLVHNSGINVDLFIHHLEDGTRWHGSIIHRWDNHDFALKTYKLDGIEVLGPVDADRYLTENYGDWRVPVTEFNSTTGTPNLGIVKNLFSVALFLKRSGHHLQAGEKQSAQKVLVRLQSSGAILCNKDNSTMQFAPDFI